ncbi:hypothetical protein CBL_12348 [Carabus blaptoides fortunei]
MNNANGRMAAMFSPTSTLEMTNAEMQNDNKTQIELIQWERELLRRERELLTKERELLNETKSVSVSPVSTFRPKDVVDLIPVFDPAKSNSLTANQWICKVETVSESYRWDDSTTLLQAISKLQGSARLWYDSATENLTTWAKLSREIINAFPTGRDESDVHIELMMKRKKKDETYEEYFYSMLGIAKKGSVSDSALIKYLITGIGDSEITRALALSEYSNPQQLLKRIKYYEDTMIQAKYRRELISRENPKTEAKSSSPFTPKVNSTPKDKSKPTSHGVYQDVMIEGMVCIPALIDTGSSVNLIKATEYLKSGSQSLNRDTIKLHGIGTAEIETLGSFETTLKINDQYFKTSVHVIPDNAMTPRMLIGNKLLENIEVLISRGEVKTIKKAEDHTEKNEIAEILNIEVETEKEDLNVARVQFQEDIKHAAEDSQTEGSLESQDGRVVGCHTSRPWVRNEPPVVSRMCTRAQSRKQAAAETECERV